MSDADLLQVAALALRWGHSLADPKAILQLTGEEFAEHQERVRKVTKGAHNEILKAHPELESKLPPGGIRSLIHP